MFLKKQRMLCIQKGERLVYQNLFGPVLVLLFKLELTLLGFLIWRNKETLVFRWRLGFPSMKETYYPCAGISRKSRAGFTHRVLRALRREVKMTRFYLSASGWTKRYYPLFLQQNLMSSKGLDCVTFFCQRKESKILTH